MRNALFFCVDRAMFPPAVFAAHSIISNARKNAFDTFIIVGSNSVEPSWIDWAQKEVGIIVKEASVLDNIGITRTANNLPAATVYRLLFEQFLPSQYDRLVYVDADIKAIRDVSQLFNLDLKDCAIAAVPSAASIAEISGCADFEAIGWDRAVPYANAGVLVINPDRWRRDELGDRTIAYLRKHFDNCLLADQSALNSIVKGRFLPISPVWNMLARYWFSTDFTDVISPAILHYAGKKKPWKPAEWGKQYGWDETVPYQNFFRNSPWQNYATILGERPNVKTLRKYLKMKANQTFKGLQPAADPLSGFCVDTYKTHISNFPFADKLQGLTTINQAGVLEIR